MSVSVSGAALTITGVAPGTATVTVTARDPAGLSASQPVDVTRFGRIEPGAGRDAALCRRDDPRGRDDNLQRVFLLLRSGRRPALLLGPDIESGRDQGRRVGQRPSPLTGVSKGQTTVDVTARDPGNLPATLSFGVNVANGPPAAVGEIPEDTLETGETAAVDLSGYFTDPDGDSLVYTATASFERIARVSVSGSTMTIEGIAGGKHVHHGHRERSGWQRGHTTDSPHGPPAQPASGAAGHDSRPDGQCGQDEERLSGLLFRRPGRPDLHGGNLGCGSRDGHGHRQPRNGSGGRPAVRRRSP